MMHTQRVFFSLKTGWLFAWGNTDLQDFSQRRPCDPPLLVNTDSPVFLSAIKQVPPHPQFREEKMDIGEEQQSAVRGTSQLTCFSSLEEVAYPCSDVAGDSKGQEGFTFHHWDSHRFCQVLTKLFKRKTRTRLGFSFVSVLLWAQAPELAAASLSLMAQGRRDIHAVIPAGISYFCKLTSCN